MRSRPERLAALLSLTVLLGVIGLLAFFPDPPATPPDPSSARRPGATTTSPSDPSPARPPGATTTSPSLAPIPGRVPAATASPAPPAAEECPVTGVRLELDRGDAAMGLRVRGLILTNCGRSPYELTDYPVVRPLDDQRVALPVRTLRGVTEITGALPNLAGPPKAFTLRPGERAVSVIAWRNTYDNISAPPVEVAHLEVTPAPGQLADIVTPDYPLDLGSTGRLGVSHWQRATEPAPATPGTRR